MLNELNVFGISDGNLGAKTTVAGFPHQVFIPIGIVFQYLFDRSGQLILHPRYPQLGLPHKRKKNDAKKK
jgi:hypothetical protein